MARRQRWSETVGMKPGAPAGRSTRRTEVGGDQERGALMTVRDQLEQKLRTGLRQRQEAQLVDVLNDLFQKSGKPRIA